jgi:hypothetical protein
MHLMQRIQRFIRYKMNGFVARMNSEIQRANQINIMAHGAAANPLWSRPIKFFSQFDEDAIVLNILRRLSVDEPHVFLEFGVGEGLENNTIILLALGWYGAWIDAVPIRFPYANSRLSFVRGWVTRDNAVALASEALSGLAASIDQVCVASVDLDGNDYHVVESLLRSNLAPDLFIVEYNPKFPPPVRFVMEYNTTHKWTEDDYYGASLTSWNELFSPNGYRLVACNLTGNNAFFINNKHAVAFADIPSNEASYHYVAGTFAELPRSGHPTSAKTVAALAGVAARPSGVSRSSSVTKRKA